jgi:hypothetical protein
MPAPAHGLAEEGGGLIGFLELGRELEIAQDALKVLESDHVGRPLGADGELQRHVVEVLVDDEPEGRHLAGLHGGDDFPVSARYLSTQHAAVNDPTEDRVVRGEDGTGEQRKPPRFGLCLATFSSRLPQLVSLAGLLNPAT